LIGVCEGWSGRTGGGWTVGDGGAGGKAAIPGFLSWKRSGRRELVGFDDGEVRVGFAVWKGKRRSLVSEVYRWSRRERAGSHMSIPFVSYFSKGSTSEADPVT
jgi:hypothetical protein